MISSSAVIRPLWMLMAASLCLADNQSFWPQANPVVVRGVQQKVFRYPGAGGSDARPCILFAPGDGGWRGFAVTVATRLASSGYDVFGFDTRDYLESFTARKALREADVAADIRTFAEAVRRDRRVVLLGWSEGAGLMVLAAAAPDRGPYAGLITMGLGEMNVLGWRLADYLTYLTRKAPNEPRFSVLPYMPKIAPLPLAMLQSSRDEYVTREEANRLFHAAAEPRRIVFIDAQNHRCDGAQAEFFRQLLRMLEWVRNAGAER